MSMLDDEHNELSGIDCNIKIPRDLVFEPAIQRLRENVEKVRKGCSEDSPYRGVLLSNALADAYSVQIGHFYSA
jgi:hypothetical protein